MGVIYVRPNLINGKKYVGQATNLEVRQNDWKNLNKRYAGAAINNARAKYGIDNFGFEILKECKDEELDYWEKYYIKELNTKVPYGYNMTDGGDGTTGYTHSAETKRKISEGHKGLVHSQETRKKLSEENKGKHLSQATRKKMSEKRKGEKHWNYGKHWSDEYKRKQIDAQKSSRKIIQINKNTNEIIAEFPSIREVERQLGFHISHISACCKGKLKTSYGYIWKYKEESVA